jgi:hypothetical protein
MTEEQFDEFCRNLGYQWSLELYCPDICCADGQYLCYISVSSGDGLIDLVEESGSTPSEARNKAVTQLRQKSEGKS